MRCVQCGISQLYIIVLHVQDVKTVVGDISGAILQLKNLSDVELKLYCDELARGVLEGLRRKQTPQHQVPSSPGKPFIATCVHCHTYNILTIMSVFISICMHSPHKQL